MIKETNGARSLNRYISLALPVSLLLHLALLLSFTDKAPAPPAPPAFFVNLVPPRPALPNNASKGLIRKAEKQIVSPPDAGSNIKPKPDTRLLSDADFGTKKEQLQRGDGLDAGQTLGDGGGKPVVEKPKSLQKPAVKQTAPAEAAGRADGKTKLAANLDLTPDYKLLSELGSKANKKTSAGGTLSSQAESPAAPFSRAPGSGAKFIGFYGSSDLLPDIRDGDITLLNAKADKFAVFVRRVATQVFYQLKLVGWKSLRADDIRQTSDFAVFVAILDPSGNLKEIQAVQGSGNRHFDQVVRDAVQKGAGDPHPPPAAKAADGNIHFIFMARSWVRTFGQSRTGAMSEQRWLVLKTGLR